MDKQSDIDIIVKNLRPALDGMTSALSKAARASEKHAGNLAFATWALVGATVALVLVTVVQVYVAALR